jgi:N-acetylneuraminic acid mutarotase
MLVVMLVNIAAVHSGEMVAMGESESGKHIYLFDELGKVKQIIKNQNFKLYPDITGDGRLLTWTEGKDQTDLNIVIYDRVSKAKRVFKNRSSFNIHPRFGARGHRVYFSMQTDVGRHRLAYYQLDECKVGDCILRKKPNMIDHQGDAYFPIPFQKSDKLVFQRNIEGLKEVVLKNFDNDETLVLGEGMSPSLSKDERYIAFTTKKENWTLNIYDIWTKKKFEITDGVSDMFSPSFNPKGDLFYSTLSEGQFQIKRISRKLWPLGYLNAKTFASSADISFYAQRWSGDTEIKMDLYPPMRGEAKSSFGAVTHKGKVYVVGGHLGTEHTYPPESFSNRLSIYDIKTKVWKEAAPRNYKAHGLTIIGYGNYIYAFGGFAYESSTSPSWKSLDVIDRYNIETNEWELVGTLPRKRSSNVSVKVGDWVYLIGGWDSTPRFQNDYEGNFHEEIDAFNLKTHQQKTLKIKLPLVRRAFSAFEREGKIYLVGGLGEGSTHFELLDLFTQFDPFEGSFKNLAPLPFATFAPAVGGIEQKAYVFGGMFKLGQFQYDYVPHIYEYDFLKNTWEHTGRYLSQSKGFSQVVLLKNGLGVLGGHQYLNNADAPVNTFEYFEVIR